ncbi:DNA repair protein RecN, partial [Bradyrhizobium canariense]
MMQGEKVATDLREAQEAIGGPHSPVSALSAAVRRLERRAANAPGLIEPAVEASGTAIDARQEAEQQLRAALEAPDDDHAALQRILEGLTSRGAAPRNTTTSAELLAAAAEQDTTDPRR